MKKNRAITKAKKPKILLLGNGINRLNGSTTWDDLLDKIKTNKFVYSSSSYEITNSLKATMLTEGNTKQRIKGRLWNSQTANNIRELKMLLDINFDIILTTNYTYEIEEYYENKTGKQRKTEWSIGKQAEKKYLIHTYNSIGNKKIFHIHGELNRLNSVVLDQDMYCRLISKIIEETYSKDYKNGRLVISSWVDAFLLGDVYIVGLGLADSEIDLWWLLEKKKNIDKGNIYYFDSKTYPIKNIIVDNKECRHELLKTFGANVKLKDIKNQDYNKYYRSIISNISKLL